MKISILLGNVRDNCNTSIVVEQFIEEFNKHGVEIDKIVVKELNIEHCNRKKTARKSGVCTD